MNFAQFKETKLFRIWLLSIFFLFFYVYMSEDFLYSTNELPSILPSVILDLVVHTHNFLLTTLSDFSLKLIEVNTFLKIISAISYILNYILISIILLVCYRFVKGSK